MGDSILLRWFLAACLWLHLTAFCRAQEPVVLDAAEIVTDKAVLPQAVDNAAKLIVARPAKSANEKIVVSAALKPNGNQIVLAVRPAKDQAPSEILKSAPKAVLDSLASLKPEGFRFYVERANDRATVWIVGADARGVLFGAGHLVRHLVGGNDRPLKVVGSTDVTSYPVYPLRGHQLGYRDRANSWDAWTFDQFEDYIRELAIFGTNAIENIPFQDDRKSPLMKYPREVMNAKMSEICAKYDLEYWVWVPADFDLKDSNLRQAALKQHEKLYADCPRLDGVFFPGGDPGDNPPELVLPFLEDCATLLQKRHAGSKVWLSMQGFGFAKSEKCFKWLDEKKPTWFGGVVCGPSSPPIRWTRQKLDARYPIRSYPDITHTVRAQYPIYWWDPAFAFTLGRECINPTPVYQKNLHNWFAPYTCGFLSYSDGVHDDVNKCEWSRLAWDPDADVRELSAEYARAFFGAKSPEQAYAFADGILALEKNWEGPLASNGAVASTFALYRGQNFTDEGLDRNWRFQMCKMRADYDQYIRLRQADEAAQQDAALASLVDAKSLGANAATDKALEILKKPVGDAEHQKVMAELRKQIETDCDKLFELIVLQTSVPKYQASGYERGCSLDFVDYPLNDRYWLEDEFPKVKKMASEAEKLARLELLRTWENPGPGSYYDDVGNVAKSIHVMRSNSASTDFLSRSDPNTSVMWWEDGKSRKKPAWITYMDWPAGIVYDHLDMHAKYLIRTTGFNQCLMRINGDRVQPTVDGKAIGDFKVFAVPEKDVKSGKLLLTFDRPDERHLNWRQHSRLCEIWLLKQ